MAGSGNGSSVCLLAGRWRAASAFAHLLPPTHTHGLHAPARKHPSPLTHTPQAIPLLKDSIKKAYGKKGDKIVNMNYAAVDTALDKLVKIDIPAGWRKGEVRARARGCV